MACASPRSARFAGGSLRRGALRGARSEGGRSAADATTDREPRSARGRPSSGGSRRRRRERASDAPAIAKPMSGAREPSARTRCARVAHATTVVAEGDGDRRERVEGDGDRRERVAPSVSSRTNIGPLGRSQAIAERPTFSPVRWMDVASTARWPGVQRALAGVRGAVAPGWPRRVNKSAVIVKGSRRPGRSEGRSWPKSAGKRPPPRGVRPLPPNDRCALRSDGRRCAPQPVSGTLRFALLLSTAGRDQDTPSSHHCRNGHQ